MTIRHPLAVVLVAATACLALGFAATPFWDEDEPRFAAIAQTMVATGDWIVPMYNDSLAVDKPVLMHWCMAACFMLFGTSESAARLPSALATLLTALALLRAGTRFFNPTTGVVAALAFVGCLLVGIESHAATPDAILVALTTWITVLAAEVYLPHSSSRSSTVLAPQLTIIRATSIGALAGLAVLCKGPIGFIGPLAVVVPWVWWIAMQRRCLSDNRSQLTLSRLARESLPATLDTFRSLRLGVVSVAMLAVAAPWYTAVSLATDGEWTTGFFLVHNVGRFVAPMEKHSGGFLFHPLAMLVGFYPWSCFLPLSMVVAGWRIWKRSDSPAVSQTLLLLLLWITIWVGAFSAAATKLPNYVLPAYPAAALLVAALGVEAARRTQWAHPRWMGSGTVSLGLGGVAFGATVLTATAYGLTDAEPAALVGAVPIVGAVACWWYAQRSFSAALAAMTLTGLVFTALAVGPAAQQIGKANALPALVQQAHSHAGGHARLGTYTHNTPNIVYYSAGHVSEWVPGQTAEALAFLNSGADAFVIVPENCFPDLAAALPPQSGIIGRARPLFQQHDFLLLGTKKNAANRSAAHHSTTDNTNR